jgi:hypothetical protein
VEFTFFFFFCCLYTWAGTALIFSSPHHGTYIITSPGSQAFKLRLNCATGFTDSPAYRSVSIYLLIYQLQDIIIIIFYNILYKYY